MTLNIGGQDVTIAAKAVTLQKARTEAAATLTAELWTAAGDAWFLKTALAVGDGVVFAGAGGTALFRGAVHQLERTPHSVLVTAYDRGVYLTRNELYGAFYGTGEAIVRQVAARLGIAVGAVDAQSRVQAITARSGDSAFAILRRAAGEDRQIRMDGEALTVTRGSGEAATLGAERFLSVESACGIGEMVNRCVVLKAGGAPLATAENAGDLAAYGQFQSVVTLNGALTQAAQQAQSALRGRTMTAQAVVLGDGALRCGGRVRVERPEWGLSGLYTLTAVAHRWQAGQYTTALTMEGTL